MRSILLGIGILSVVLVSCRKEKAAWESNWTLPLVNDTLDLKNLVTDSILGVNGSGFYQLEINRNIFDVQLADYIEIPDTTVSQQYAISGSLNVTAGTSFVNNNKDHNFDLQGAQMKKVRISTGSIKVSVESPIETKTIFTVKLPKAKKNGQAISQTFHAPPGTNENPSVVSNTIDLAGYELDLTGSTGGGFNLLQSQMIIQTDPDGDAVSVNNTDTSKFIIEMKGIRLDYGRGYFGNLVIEDTTDLYVDFLNKITAGNLNLPATSIAFIISNGIKVAGKATLNTLSNTNEITGNTVALSHPQLGLPFTIEQATGTWDAFFASIRTLLFTSSNSNVEQFIENLGAKQKINFKVELNPQGNTSAGWDEFFPNSKLQVLMKAQMPLSAALTNLTIQDTFAINLANDTEKTHIASGKIKLGVSNAFPLQGEVRMFLLNEANQVVETILGSSEIMSSVYGTAPVSGELQKANSTIYFDLNQQTLNQLDQIKKIVVRVVLNTPNPTTQTSDFVTIPEGAYVGLKVNTSFQLENRL